MKRFVQIAFFLFFTMSLAICLSACSTEYEEEKIPSPYVSIISPKDKIEDAWLESKCFGSGFYMDFAVFIDPAADNEKGTGIIFEDTTHASVSDLHIGDNIIDDVKNCMMFNYPYSNKDIKKGKLIVEDVGPHYAILRFENFTLEPYDTTFEDLVINARIYFHDRYYRSNEPVEPGQELTPTNLIGDWTVTSYVPGDRDITDLDVFAYYLHFGYFRNNFFLEDSKNNEDYAYCNLTGNRITTEDGYIIDILNMDRNELTIKVPSLFGSMELKMKRLKYLNDSDIRTILTKGFWGINSGYSMDFEHQLYIPEEKYRGIPFIMFYEDGTGYTTYGRHFKWSIKDDNLTLNYDDGKVYKSHFTIHKSLDSIYLHIDHPEILRMDE